MSQAAGCGHNLKALSRWRAIGPAATASLSSAILVPVNPPACRRPGRRDTLKLIAASAGAGVAAAWLAPAARASETASPVARSRLVVAAFPAVDEMVRAAAARWREWRPEVDIQVISRQFGDHHTALTTALSTSTQLPDVMALEVGFVARFARGVGLEDLSGPAYGAQALADRWVPFATAQALDRRGRLVAAPLDIGPGTLLYRRDLVERAGVAPAALGASWDSYLACGRRIREATGAALVAHAREVKDILIRSGIEPGQGLYFDSQSRVLVNSPRFERAFALAREVRLLGLDRRLSAWSNEWSEAFRRGGLATQMSGAWLAGHLSNWLAPKTRGLWRAAPLPEATEVAFGGTFLAIPRAAAPERKGLAWEFIRLMTIDRSVQLASFRRHDAFPALLAAHEDAYFDEPIEFLGGQPARQLWRDSARRIRAVGVHRQDPFAAEVIDTELDKVLDRGKDIGKALADAERLLSRRAHR